MQLDERKRLVLRAIIEDYIDSAEPVGSRTIARKYQLGVSPATIRNEMADLEEMGFIEQPHTSAGRVPSDRGYRFYVDSLMEPKRLAPRDTEVICRAYQAEAREVQAVIERTAQLLSRVTDYVALVVGPRLDTAVFRRIEVVPVKESTALITLITGNGLIQNKLVEVPEGLTTADLRAISDALNHHMVGVPLNKMSRTLIRAMSHEIVRHQLALDRILEVLEHLGRPDDGERVFLGGTTNILAQPEFRDVEKVRGLFSMLERLELVRELMADSGQGMLSVSIGEENKLPEVADCSLIKATYSINGQVVGTLGVIGPRRMHYDRAT